MKTKGPNSNTLLLLTSLNSCSLACFFENLKMKQLALFLMIGFAISCKPSYVNIESKIEGDWALSSFSYTDTTGKVISSSPSNVGISFFGKNERKGVLRTSTGEYIFEYNFGPDKCNLDFNNERVLPLEAIGKVQVYSYNLLDKDKLIFSVDKEYDYTTNSVIENATYTFVRR